MTHNRSPIFLLDEPHYHQVRRGAVSRFRGLALAIDGDPIDMMRAGDLDVPVNLPSPDVAAFLHVPGAERCRFDFEMRIDGPFEFVANGRTLWRFSAEDPLPAETVAKILRVPVPSSEIIAVTQGGGNVDSYRDSIVSGLATLKSLVSGDPRRILDIGCGTGRLLVGWWADDPSRRLVGVDINTDLIEWNAEHLREVAGWRVNSLAPPLPLEAGFDLIQVVSVFTHLPFDLQRAWVDEIRRLLRPGGSAIITLHGRVYADLLLDQEHRRRFDLDGHVSVRGAAEGANAFASFHREAFARDLFSGFDVTFHERGPWGRFPIASLQDVYVLRRR